MRAENLRVLHINSYYAFAPFFRNLYDSQRKHNLDIDVYIPAAYGWNLDKQKYGQYTKVRKIYNTFDRIKYFSKHNKIFDAIKNDYEIKDFDLVHAHSLFSNGYVAYKLYQQFKIPYVVAVRNTDINVFFKKMIHLRKIGIDILKNASKIVFLSKAYEELLVKKYIPNDLENCIRSKMVIIPNGIYDFWLENRYYRNDNKNKSVIHILCVGDIDRNKNHIATVNAAKELIKTGHSVKVSIVGRIKNKHIYKKLIKNDFVQYKGTMHKDELLKEYRLNDIFVMPSKTETFGLVYAEAMSQGMPIIYTKNQGFDGQFCEGYVGYHVKYNDYRDIAKKISRIYSEYKKKSVNCTNSVDKFDWNEVTANYIDLYESI